MNYSQILFKDFDKCMCRIVELGGEEVKREFIQ